MAPNRRSIPGSLSLSDSSDPESWGSMNSSNVNNVKGTPLNSNGLVTAARGEPGTGPSGDTGRSTNPNGNPEPFLDSRVNSFSSHSIEANKNHLSPSANNGLINCAPSSSSTPLSSLSSTPSSTLNNSHPQSNHNNGNPHANNPYPWRNWPRIDLISSIDLLESTGSMISAFACVAHVVNGDSANGDEPGDGDNQTTSSMDHHGSEHRNKNNNEEDNGSYDSSNHSNSLESPENYRPILKPLSFGYPHSNTDNNSNKKTINRQGNIERDDGKFNGTPPSPDDRLRCASESGQLSPVKPSPPPLSTIPRPLQSTPPPNSATTVPTSQIPPTNNSISSSSPSPTPTSAATTATPVTAKDHLYETIYPSNIRLTRDSKYFVDYQNVRSLLDRPVAVKIDEHPPNPNQTCVNTTNHQRQSQHQSSSRSLPVADPSKDMARRSTYNPSSASSSSSKFVRKSTTTHNNSYKIATSANRLSLPPASSIVNSNQNQARTKQPLHPYNNHRLPGHSNSMYKPSSSPAHPSSSPQLSSPLPPTTCDYSDRRMVRRSIENSPSANQLPFSSKSTSSCLPINRPNHLTFNKPKNIHHNQQKSPVDRGSLNSINCNHKLATSPSTTTSTAQAHGRDKPQTLKANDLKPDQVYPNSVSVPIISRANVRSTEEYATINKARTLKAIKSATLTSPSKDDSSEATRSPTKDNEDSPLSSVHSKGKDSIDSPMSPIASQSTLSSLGSPITGSDESNSNNRLDHNYRNHGSSDSPIQKKGVGGKSKHKPNSPEPSPSPVSSSSRSFLSKFFSLRHVLSRTFSVEKIDKHHRSLPVNGKERGSSLLKSAISTPALSSTSTRNGFFTDLNGNKQPINPKFPSIRDLAVDNTVDRTQESLEPVSLGATSASGSKSLQSTKSTSSSSFVRAFKNRLSLRRSRRKVKVKVDVTRTKSDPRNCRSNRYEDEKMTLPMQQQQQPGKDEAMITGSIVSVPGDSMKVVEIHRPQGKPFGFFVARGTVNNIKGIFISRIDSSGEKAYQDLLEIGDQLIEIDGADVTEASVIQVNQLMSNKTKLTLKIVPFCVLASSK